MLGGPVSWWFSQSVSFPEIQKIKKKLPTVQGCVITENQDGPCQGFAVCRPKFSFRNPYHVGLDHEHVYPPPCPMHARAHVILAVWCLVLIDPQPRDWFYLCGLRYHSCTLFASFSELLFLQRTVPKGLKSKPRSKHKSQINNKNHHQNAATSKTCKKTPPGRGQNFKIHDHSTVLSVFSKVQGSEKWAQTGAKMEPQGTQKHKNQEKWAL